MNLDFTLERYNHGSHFHQFWPIYDLYWNEVNQKNLNFLVNVEHEGTPIISSGLEQKIVAALAEGAEFKLVMNGNKIIGFCQYKTVEGGVLYISGMYVIHEYRYHGVAKFIINSFPGVGKFLFQTHKSCPPIHLLKGLMTAKKIGNCEGNDDLELWEAFYVPQVQGKNDYMNIVREETA